jgi:hypothetical protein
MSKSRALTFLVLGVLGAPAPAQPVAPITAAPLMPPTTQPPLATPPPANQAPGQPQQGASQPMQQTWIPADSAQLQVLDKVNAQNAVLTVKVGQEAQYGSLSIQVLACDIHPPDQPRDSAAYLAITDSHADAPSFRGWMLANDPSVSMLQHPIYDVRVVGCTT